MVDKPLDVVESIIALVKQGNYNIVAKISDCIIVCNDKQYKLNGVDFNRVVNVFGLLNISYKVS